MRQADGLDLLVIGGGVNGAGIARDAAGRGLKVVLCEAGDLASGTSSASSKLVHGGLRYLEFGEVGLVRKALAERDRLLRAAPHIAWPQPFLLPLVSEGRPAWLIRLALLAYDHLAPRRRLPRSARVDLRSDVGGWALKREIRQAFRYFDGWVEDARLVVLLARDAARRGARILTREAVTAARLQDGWWEVTTSSGRTLVARRIVNATGPWAGRVAREVLKAADAPRLRLVQGAHLVVRRVNRTADAFTLQQPDRRIVFLLPFGRDLSLLGTTETPVPTPDHPQVTAAEEAYLLAAANRVLRRPLSEADVRHRFAGVRPLVLEERRSDRETTRDWRFVDHAGLPATTVVGGKLTTFRRLAEELVSRLFPHTRPWTAEAVLPGGDIPDVGGRTPRANFEAWARQLARRFPDHDPRLVHRLAGLYGTDAEGLLAGGLGARAPDGLFEAEAAFLKAEEFAHTREDMLWRRTRLGLAALARPGWPARPRDLVSS
ncbi:MAG: glycerol-3-phosphate dehydrogenase [Sphingomonadaceae bacterium]|uniref:glycerol-3-phosphate dehydrogenase n=1 Tax=Thermaurantiacus sp. TaxID=2820283 RepID=UPI00298F1F3E|nr:glycerol-3-phosphate dehydrogenase [Thermaurantiacus sp.]MCS6986959.1 glycerol-3-phosphate dehydrogenase [Sphingomonadaceae bacterium]MDW8415441.1 glycerol-3-phosphate dehydrogenase [Thermaurantiacus sp.]